MSKVNTQYIPESTRNRKDFDVRAGDTVRVNLKIQEKGKTRIQTFEGLVLARKHGSENGGTITVRKVSNGVGVERIFPIYSPAIESIEITRRAKVRRSKLYFLRDAVAKTMRYKLRRITDKKSSTGDLPAWETEEDILPEDLEMEPEAVTTEKSTETAEDLPAEKVGAKDDSKTTINEADVKAEDNDKSEDLPAEDEGKTEAPAEETPTDNVEEKVTETEAKDKKEA